MEDKEKSLAGYNVKTNNHKQDKIITKYLKDKYLQGFKEKL